MMANLAMTGAACEPARQTEVSAAIDDLAKAVSGLQQEAEWLCERLGAVQRGGGNVVGAGPDNPAAPQPVLCPLASQLRSLREAIEHTRAQLEGNRNRLEI